MFAQIKDGAKECRAIGKYNRYGRFPVSRSGLLATRMLCCH